MSDKERLEEIKEKYSEVTVLEYINNVEIVGVDIKDLVWLIKQAEKVEQLQWENDWLNTLLAAEKRNRIRASNEATSYKQQLQQAQTKAERYEKALRKIIDESICRGEDCTWGDTCYAVISRKVLEGENNDG